MSRRATADLPLPFALLRQPGAPGLAEQIALQLRQAVLGGALRSRDRLPSTRGLAERLGVARVTVETAYAQLVAEGYLEARGGSGTRIAAELPEDSLAAPKPAVASAAPAAPGLPPHVAALEAVLRSQVLQQPVPLAVLAPGAALSPGKAWSRIAVRLARTPWRHGNYAAPHGHGPLRDAIADYVRRMRGLRCAREQVLVTAGTQQGLSLCAQVLFAPGDAVWVENPCYQPLAAVLRHARLQPMPVPVDARGLAVEQGIGLAPAARGAFVTPSHQYPLGMVMSMDRRLALLDWAQRAGAWIVEDDYDSELRYAGRPFPALQGLAGPDGPVVYMGTFSKMLFPGLRLGYLVVPPALVDGFAGARLLADRQSAGNEQALLAEFMAGGHYEAHVRRIRALFAERRGVLMAECQAQLAEFGAVLPGDQGMHVVFRLDDAADDQGLSQAARAIGVECRPLSPNYLPPLPPWKGLILGFGGFTPEAIHRAVQRLRRVLQQG